MGWSRSCHQNPFPRTVSRPMRHGCSVAVQRIRNAAEQIAEISQIAGGAGELCRGKRAFPIARACPFGVRTRRFQDTVWIPYGGFLGGRTAEGRRKEPSNRGRRDHPQALCFQRLTFLRGWWRGEDSNLRSAERGRFTVSQKTLVTHSPPTIYESPLPDC